MFPLIVTCTVLSSLGLFASAAKIIWQYSQYKKSIAILKERPLIKLSSSEFDILAHGTTFPDQLAIIYAATCAFGIAAEIAYFMK